MSTTRYCHDCTNYTATPDHPMDVCRLKHKPRFYKPLTMSQAHTSNWGWKKRCADFVAWVKGEQDMTKEALKLALEALGWTDEWRPQGLKEEAITAIKAALEAKDGECKHCTDGCPACDARKLPEQEPVAWRYRWSVEGGNWVWNYATYIERQKDDRCEPLYTAPPQRTWVGLTDKDWNRSKHNYDFQKGVDWAESILKEKNT